jgi:hypothetical protein
MKSLIWFLIALALITATALLFPLQYVVEFKGFYIIGGALLAVCFLYLAFKNADSVLALFQRAQRNKEPKLSNLKKFLLAFSLIIFMGVLGGASYFRIDERLKERGVFGDAVISGGAKTTRKSIAKTENSFGIDISFKAKTGQIVNTTENVTEEEYNNLSVDMPIQIIYDSMYPKILRVLLSEDDKIEFIK